LLGLDCGLNLQMDDDGPTAKVLVGKKGKRKVDGIDLDSPITSSMTAAPAQSLRKSTMTKSSAHDIQHCIARFDVPPGSSTTKINHTPVYLRSTRIPKPKTSAAPRVTEILDEMAVPYERLVIPSQSNLSQLRGVFEAAEALVETKRAVERV